MLRHTGMVLALGSILALGSAMRAWAHGITERVSVGPGGAQANAETDSYGSLSADGHFVAFGSRATNLVQSDTNDFQDIFVRNLEAGVTRRVSIGPHGQESDGYSFGPMLSPDGRFVVFSSTATNLLSDHAGGGVFIRDMRTDKTVRVSVDGGAPAGVASMSADLRFVAFGSSASLVPGDSNGMGDIFVVDRRTRHIRRISVGVHGAQGNASSGEPAISSDGRYIAFMSFASNLVPNDTNDEADIFVRDLKINVTRRVSVGTGGIQGNSQSRDPAISASGRFVTFASNANNLTLNDINNATDVFVHDLKSDVTRLVSLSRNGVQGNMSSESAQISADGMLIAFVSEASNIVADDSNGVIDAFVCNLKTGIVRLVSVNSGGIQANNNSAIPKVSANGRVVSFHSLATNLVPEDTNGTPDVFIRRLIP